MTLEEAIRVNTVLKKAPVLKEDPIIIATLNLNIEALEFILQNRGYGAGFVPELLTGETED